MKPRDLPSTAETDEKVGEDEVLMADGHLTRGSQKDSETRECCT